MTDDWDNSAWLSPWQLVQLIVALDPAFGPEVARLAPEHQVRDVGCNVLFLSLHRSGARAVAPPSDKLLWGSRAVGAFRAAMEKISDWCKAGRIAAKRRSKTGDLVLVDSAEFRANKINFEKGTIGRSPAETEQLFLNRDDTINLLAPSTPAPTKDRESAGNGAEIAESPPCTAAVAALTQKAPKTATKRGGSTRGIDWAMVDEEVSRLVDENGDFVPADPNWDCQARLEKAIRDFIKETFKNSQAVKDEGPAESTLRSHVTQSLTDWRADKGRS
jgi:hypothetical protein